MGFVAPSCTLPQFLNLPILQAPAPKSIISSSLWNAIVNNIYSAYNSLVIIKQALNVANYMNLSAELPVITNALYSPTPYALLIFNRVESWNRDSILFAFYIRLTFNRVESLTTVLK